MNHHHQLTAGAAALLTGAALTACGGSAKDERYLPTAYPEARYDSSIVDVYYGTEVPDPYRWLENDTSAETRAWVAAQQALTEEYFRHVPAKDTIYQRLCQLYDYQRVSIPGKSGGHYFFSQNDGLQNQSVIYVQDSLTEEPRVFLDPNTLSDDGTVAYAGMSVSKDGRYAAYLIHRNGSDWTEIYVKEIATGRTLDDHIVWAKFTSAAWCGDGFYYSAYDAPDAHHAYSQKNEGHKVYYHRLGTPQADDRLVYATPDAPLQFHAASLSADERYLFLTDSDGGAGNSLRVLDLKKAKDEYLTISDDMQVRVEPIEVIGDTLYLFTNYQAPKGRVCKASIRQPGVANWKEVIPEGDYTLASAQLADGHIIAVYDQDACNHAYVYTMQGRRLHEVEFPTFGSVWFSCHYDDPEVFYSFTSFVFPATAYKYDVRTNRSELYKAPACDVKPDDYVTEELFVTSKDGTQVPLFVTYKKGLKRDGSNPTYLYAYGGFSVSLNPLYVPSRMVWLEHGGIYAEAILRGGGEYGEDWHEAGTKMKKQNVFDDFIASAEYLISEGYTSPERLCIEGASNGGLLIGACVNQRPDLYAVAIPQVGVMDMLRYHKFTVGWNWASDYGRSDESPEMFQYLKGYSPLHTIQSGKDVHYPAILVTTADHDDRVVPAHSFKYAATLQASQTGPEPKLILIESNAGHGAGKPMSKVLDEKAKIYSFILYNMGIAY
jgi:prolyl oligopeptidase